MKHAREDYNRIQDPSGKIPQDEPVFLLRGQDISAPETLRYWAVRNATVGGSYKASLMALEWAERMEEWQEEMEFGGKPADLPGEEP